MQEFQTNFRQVLGSLPPSVKYLPIVFPKSTSKYENLWLCLRLHLHNFYGLILFPELPRCVQITECLAMSFIIISNLQTVLARANIFAKLTQTCVKISIHQILLRCHTATIHTTHTFFLIYWMDIALFHRQFLAAQNDAPFFHALAVYHCSGFYSYQYHSTMLNASYFHGEDPHMAASKLDLDLSRNKSPCFCICGHLCNVRNWRDFSRR